jgi:hypothetical protein
MSRTSERLTRRALALTVSLLVMVATLAAAGTASATFTVRRYTVGLEAPSCIAAGARSTFTATITNSPNSTRPLGSAKIDSDDNPSFSGIADIAITNAPAGSTWTAAPDHSNPDGVVLRATSSASALAPGRSVTVTFSAVAPSTSGTKTWKTFAWERTDFTQSFSQPSSFPKVAVAKSCVGPPASIEFTKQPVDTLAGGVIASTGGGPVQVKVRDAFGNGLGGVTVSMALGAGANGATLDGDLTQVTDQAGLANFNDLTIDEPGQYSLVASAGSVTGESSLFEIVGQLCQEDMDCSASFTGNGGLSSTMITMNQFNPGSDTDEGVLLARFDTEQLLDCDFLNGTPYEEFTDFTSIYEYSNDERTATIRTVVKKALFNQVANNGASKLEVCFQAKLPFLLEDGKTFVQMQGGMTAPGLLPGCNKVNASLYPCISKQQKQGGDAIVIYKVPGRFNVDPRGRS